MLHHVTFHTLYSKPIFEDAMYDHTMRQCLRDVILRRKILCPCWEVMPSHVHMIVAEFEDFPLPAVVNALKGATSHAFLKLYPALRADLLGGHLWTKGYYSVGIVTQRQFLSTLSYIRTNRVRAGLPPPTAPENYSYEAH